MGDPSGATIDLFAVDDAARMQRAIAIRTRVFMDEQGVPAEEEIDEHDRTDADAVHALARAEGGGEFVGTGRFFAAAPGCAQIGRMAVLGAHRGTGIGRAILDALIDEAVRRGYDRAQLLAQVHAIPFYVRAGFAEVPGAADVWDAGIVHRWMNKALPEGLAAGRNVL